jgi:hypothetical protein
VFRDIDGNQLVVGDPVTVVSSKRHYYLIVGSHGEVEEFGTDLVDVRITQGRSELDDYTVKDFEADELRKGHHGHPRQIRGPVGPMREMFIKYRNEELDRLIRLSVRRGIINEEQAKAMNSLVED